MLYITLSKLLPPELSFVEVLWSWIINYSHIWINIIFVARSNALFLFAATFVYIVTEAIFTCKTSHYTDKRLTSNKLLLVGNTSICELVSQVVSISNSCWSFLVNNVTTQIHNPICFHLLHVYMGPHLSSQGENPIPRASVSERAGARFPTAH